MEMTRTDVIKRLLQSESFFVLFSGATNSPFIVCDPESFNDQVWIFDSKENLENATKEIIEAKNPVGAVQVPKKNYLPFFSSLLMLGVNSIVFHGTTNKMEVELDELVKTPDTDKLPKEKRPLINKELQLSGIYFMQELRRGVENKEKPALLELHEEMAVNLVRSRYMVAIQPKENPEDEKNVTVPYIKNKEGEIFQPIFTDAAEFSKFNKDQKFRAIIVPFENLPKILIPNAKGVTVNPFGFNLVVIKEQLTALKERFQPVTE